MILILAISAGLFFATSVAGWIVAVIKTVALAREESRNHYLALQWQQAVASNSELARRLHAMEERLEEMGIPDDDDDEGEEWKKGPHTRN